MLIVAVAAGLLSVTSSALAQGKAYSEETSTPISQEALDNLLAPIALYPDVLLAQVLMAATYPWEVIEAARWQEKNSDLEGDELQDELEFFDWDPSVKSLVTVPQVLQYMAGSPRWMQDLGRIVVEDQPRVMETVQMLRQKARAAGALTSNDKQVVEVKVDATRKVEYITIAPPATQVVYVPVYDTRVVYGNWWWPSRPVYWGPPVGVVLTSGYYWGPRHYSSVALWGSFNWGGGLITINAPVYRNYYRHAPPRMGPNYGWNRPPPPRGYYNRPPPPRSPYAGRSPGRDSRSSSYGQQGRDSRQPSRDRPRGDVSGRDRSRGDTSGGSRQAGAQPLRSETQSGADRSRSSVSGEPRQAGGRQDRSERPSSADRSRGTSRGFNQTDGQQGGQMAPSNMDRSRGGGELRQAGGRTGRPETSTGAGSQRGSTSSESRSAGRAAQPEVSPRGGSESRQAGGQSAGAAQNAPSLNRGDARQAGRQSTTRSERPSGADRQRGNTSNNPGQTAGQQSRQATPPSADRQRGNAPNNPAQAAGQPSRQATPPSTASRSNPSNESRSAGRATQPEVSPRGGGESRQAGGQRGGGSGERQGGGRGGRQQ
ncbi:MAG: DUF3300 domain-containing protein [Burkholderiales bacterium]|nr:DUF3300 domain-containing protein [Burkholderiales bacterium]